IGNGDTGQEEFWFSGTISVNGDLTLDFNVTGTNGWVAINGGGTLQVVGNITQDTGWFPDNGSTTTLVWVGSGSKSFTQAAGSYFPLDFTISGAGTLNMGSSAAFLHSFTYLFGTAVAATTTSFLCPSYGAYTISPGSMSFNNVSFGDGTKNTGYPVHCTLNGTMAVG